MDILEPELMWIEGRCYRVPSVDPYFCRVRYLGLKGEEFEEMDSSGEFDALEDEIYEMPKIAPAPNGKLKMVFPVGRAFLPFIIGSKGSTVRRISHNTSCTILTPKFHEKQDITIYGDKKERVILAWKSILNIIKTSRKKLTATHFISIPLNSQEIRDSFVAFKDEVLTCCRQRGICEELFQDIDKLHLTLLVCTLTDNNERNLAESQFHDICENFIRPLLDNHKPCILIMEGLDYMNDDPTDVKTLYAKVKIFGEDGLLQEICDELNVTFKAVGLLKDESLEVKVHVTLMNTTYLCVKSGDECSDDADRYKYSKVSGSFDATEILKRFHDRYFGQQVIRTIHLSTRFTVDENGYYKYIAKVDL